jgi:hypothetical protein
LSLTLATVGVFAGIVALTVVLGWFAVGTKSLAEEVRESKTSEPTAQTTAAVPSFNPDLIKGKNTFAEVADLTGIARQEFIQKFKITEADLDKPIKDGASLYSTFATGDVRVFVAEKLGIAGYTSTETVMAKE